MENVGKTIGILALIAAAIYAAQSYANTTDSDFTFPSFDFGDGTDTTAPPINYETPPPTDEAIADMPSDTNWKTNEYPKYADFIASTERRYNIPTDLLARLLYQESRYRVDVITGANRSPVGAVGIAQFMPATAAELHVDRLDPLQSIDGAGKYLKQMYDRFNNWQYALMAYNWGPGNVSAWLQGNRSSVPAETQNYVAQITADVSVA